MNKNPTAAIIVVLYAILSGCVRADQNDSESGTSETGGEVGEGTSGGTSGGDADTGDVTTGDTTDDADVTEGDDGCAFPGCPDFIEPPPSCDIWAQDCPEGQKCTAYAADGAGYWNANRCVPVDPAMDQPGESCGDIGEVQDGLDTCDKGGICWDVDPDTMIGYCIAFCTGSEMDPVCEDGDFCGIYNDGVLPICQADCDPLAIDCPNPDNLCVPHPSDEGFVCMSDGSGGMGIYGAECGLADACNPGLFCAAGEFVPGCISPGCCSEFCDINLPNSCAGMADGQECIPWWPMGMAPMGLDHVGGCGVP